MKTTVHTAVTFAWSSQRSRWSRSVATSTAGPACSGHQRAVGASHCFQDLPGLSTNIPCHPDRHPHATPTELLLPAADTVGGAGGCRCRAIRARALSARLASRWTRYAGGRPQRGSTTSSNCQFITQGGQGGCLSSSCSRRSLPHWCCVLCAGDPHLWQGQRL
jgi:hypothetical protein